MFFDGILSCLKGAPLLSSCFYPPSPSDDSINEIVIAETDKLAKTIAEIESRQSCFNESDETDYQIAIAVDPKKKVRILLYKIMMQFAKTKRLILILMKK